MADIYLWVYQYELPDARSAGACAANSRYRTPESVHERGGRVLVQTAKQVPAYEIRDGLWTPDRNPVV